MPSDLSELRLVLGLTGAERDQLRTTVDTVSDATGHSADDCLEACYRLACAGADTETVMTVLPSLALYADRHSLDVVHAAEMTARVCHAFGRDPAEMGAVWAAIDRATIDEPLQAREILRTLETVSPHATHNGYSLTHCLTLIGEESRQTGVFADLADRVEGRILEESMDGYDGA